MRPIASCMTQLVFGSTQAIGSMYFCSSTCTNSLLELVVLRRTHISQPNVATNFVMPVPIAFTSRSITQASGALLLGSRRRDLH